MQNLSLTDPWALLAVAVAMALGGLLKGATGAGTPILAVPVLASVFDVRIAVAVMVVPNLVSNLSQMYRFRSHALSGHFARNFAISGALGAALGTLFLAWAPVGALNLAMAAIIVGYIALKVARPGLRMPMPLARRLVWVAGGGGGILQGSVGISAPIALTFLNSVALPRPVFILTVSTFFAGMCVLQLPVQIAYGLMTPQIALLGGLSLMPLLAAMPLGDWIGRRVSSLVFDRIILGFLGLLALRLIVTEFT